MTIFAEQRCAFNRIDKLRRSYFILGDRGGPSLAIPDARADKDGTAHFCLDRLRTRKNFAIPSQTAAIFRDFITRFQARSAVYGAALSAQCSPTDHFCLRAVMAGVGKAASWNGVAYADASLFVSACLHDQIFGFIQSRKLLGPA